VATLLDDSGTLELQLGRRLGAGTVIALAEPGDTARLEDTSCDGVFALLTAGFGGESLLREALRIARPRAPVAVITYSAEDPPAHEAVLVAAGLRGPFLDALLPRRLVASAVALGFTATAVRDVARFDSPAEFWRVMVDERALQGDVDREAVEAGLRPWLAADDTLRIPVVATLLRR
jgi:hypothetical protein